MSLVSKLLKQPLQALEDRIASAKNEAKIELSIILARVIVVIVLVLLLFVMVCMLSVGVAIIINKQIGSPYVGYLIVAGFYLLLSIAGYILSKQDGFKKVMRAYMDGIVFKQKRLK